MHGSGILKLSHPHPTALAHYRKWLNNNGGVICDNEDNNEGVINDDNKGGVICDNEVELLLNNILEP